MRTLVTFQSDAFNTTEPRDYFINPGCFGDDLCNWLAGELMKNGLQEISEPDQEDFGWFLRFKANGVEHDFVVGFRDDDNEDEKVWIGWIEKAAGLVGSIFGGRKRGIERAAVEAVHRSLAGSDRIRNVRWHDQKDFDSGAEEKGTESPF